MEIYLCNTKTARDSRIVFKDYIALVQDHLVKVELLKPKAARKVPTKAKGKGKEKATEDYDEEDVEDTNGRPDKSATELFLSKFDMTPMDFYLVEREIKDKMDELTNKTRLSNHLGVRMMTASGLLWNYKSNNKIRDFMNIAIAITLESIIAASYRGKLLINCHWGNKMRDDLQKYFLSVARSFRNYFDEDSPEPSVQKKHKSRKPVAKWEFADSFPVDIGLVGSEPFDPVTLANDLQAAHASVLKKNKDPRMKLVDYIMKIGPLKCTEPTVSKTTLETAAFYHVRALLRVRFHSLASPINSDIASSNASRT